MHPHLKSLLVKAGCDPNATDEEAQSFYDGMAADAKSDIEGQLARMMDGGGDAGALAAGKAAAAAAATKDPAAAPAGLSAAQVTQIATQAALAAVQKATNVDPDAIARLAAQKGRAGAAVDDDEAQIHLEEKRVGNLRKLAQLHKIPDGVLQEQIGKNASVADARVAFLKHVHETAKPLAAVKVGEDKQVAGLRAALPHAMMLRAGIQPRAFEVIGEKPHEMATQLRGHRFLDMYRHYLAALGCQEVWGYSQPKLADILGPKAAARAFPKLAALAESTSDFSSITLDAIHKTLRFYYLDAKRTWPLWAEKTFNSDFKNINRVVLSEMPSMVNRTEGEEVQYVQLKDSKEVYALSEYAAGLRLTRRVIINDDLNAFAGIPRLQANTAARQEDDVAYAVLTGNAVMADGNAIFSTAHLNYDASGSGPSIASLQTGATKVKKQKGLAGAARLELEPKFLLVPTSIEEQTKELIGSKTLIASQSSSGSAPLTVGDSNPFYNRYTVIGSTRLDDNSATKWYLGADYRDGQVNGAEVCFLTDEPEPVMRQETDFDTEDVKFLVRHTVAAKMIDYRGWYANNGV